MVKITATRNAFVSRSRCETYDAPPDPVVGWGGGKGNALASRFSAPWYAAPVLIIKSRRLYVDYIQGDTSGRLWRFYLTGTYRW